jgi:hypothetical protein
MRSLCICIASGKASLLTHRTAGSTRVENFGSNCGGASRHSAIIRVYNTVWKSIYHGGLIGLFEESGSCVRGAGSSSECPLHGNRCAHSLNTRASGTRY